MQYLSRWSVEVLAWGALCEILLQASVVVVSGWNLTLPVGGSGLWVGRPIGAAGSFVLEKYTDTKKIE